MILVFLGGFCGVLARYGVVQLFAPLGAPFPLAIGLANLSGAFALGFLVTALARAVRSEPQRARIRAFLGTGFCGGFTTYSALVVDAIVMIQRETDAIALIAPLYVILSVLLGVTCAHLGMRFGARHPRIEDSPTDSFSAAASHQTDDEKSSHSSTTPIAAPAPPPSPSRIEGSSDPNTNTEAPR